jgi:hypothetical protein
LSDDTPIVIDLDAEVVVVPEEVVVVPEEVAPPVSHPNIDAIAVGPA